MISRLFTLFIVLSACPLLANSPALTLDNLHILTFEPTISIQGKKIKYIPQWYETIKKKGIPGFGVAIIPTNKVSTYWQFTKGIPLQHKEPIFIHSGPHDAFWDRLFNGRTGHGIRTTHAWLKHSIINGTFATFDYFYDRKDFDFGQGINIQALNTVYSQINQKNPEAPLVIAATCIGAKIALEFTVAHAPKNLAALILETPFIDANKFINNMSKNHLNWLPFADDADKIDLFKGILKKYAPNYKISLRTPHAKLETINPMLPIFIAHLKNDSLYTDEHMHQLVTDLRKSGNQDIYLLILQDSKTKHGHLNQKKEFAQAVNAFLAQYNLPHDAQLAQEGATLLADAKINVQASSPANWRIVESEKIG